MTVGLILRLMGRCVVRPSRVIDLLTMWWAFRRPGSLRMARPYLAWRLHTYHGDDRHRPTAEEILAFARWRREMGRQMKG